MAAGAEFLGVGELQRGIESVPEHQAGYEAREHQHAEPEHRTRPAQHIPELDDEYPHPRLVHVEAEGFGFLVGIASSDGKSVAADPRDREGRHQHRGQK